MVRYGDYFSRKTLHYCGVSPEEKLFKKDETAYTGTQRMEKIRLDISKIYQTLYRGYTENSASQSTMDFSDLQVERKIVTAFYDSGMLNNAERDYFYSQNLQSIEREQISVEEANTLSQTGRSQKPESQVKTPLLRNVRQ